MKTKAKWKVVWGDKSKLEFETTDEAFRHFEGADKGTKLYMKQGMRWKFLVSKQKD